MCLGHGLGSLSASGFKSLRVLYVIDPNVASVSVICASAIPSVVSGSDATQKVHVPTVVFFMAVALAPLQAARSSSVISPPADRKFKLVGAKL